MNKSNPLLRFAVRWIANALGLWLASRFIGSISYQNSYMVIFIAGGVLSLINGLIKPLIVVYSLPFILLTLGLFTLVVNGAMVLLVHFFYRPFHVKGFRAAIVAGLVVSLVNYLVTTILEMDEEA